LDELDDEVPEDDDVPERGVWTCENVSNCNESDGYMSSSQGSESYAPYLFDFELELFKDVLRGGNACISHQQGGFKFGVSLLVQQFACEHRGNAAAGALQTAAQSTQPVAAGHFGCLAGASAYAWRGFSFE
jgi:hypothetical protein